jgi:hypothetical protein
MIKEITSREIETLKYMFRTFPEGTRKTLIESQCMKYIITPDFVIEFLPYISKESFSTSPGLKYGIIERFPELFDYNSWKTNREKELEPLLNDEFLNSYAKTNEEVESILLSSNPSNITKEIFDKYFEKLSDNVKSYFVNNSKLTSEEMVRKYPSAINEDIFKNKYAEIEWSNSLIEHILKNKKLTVKFLFTILLHSNNPKFVNDILNRDLNIERTANTFDLELKNFLFSLHADNFQRVFQLLDTYSPNAITYSVLERILDLNDFLSEKFLIENIEYFKKNNLLPKLAQYARKNEYDALMVLLRLS